ncbi:MAG TPA: S41 family peptidase [Bryobacteraceae bacterium]|nr:S41 family peptidase [Bryobacteraceae bacterium]
MPVCNDFPPVRDARKLTRSAWRAWTEQKDVLGLQHLRIQPIEEFTKQAELKTLSIDQKHVLLDQAELLFRNLYAHLPFKQELYPDADPFTSLQGIREQISDGTMPELDFHLSLLLTFANLRDSHTRYEMPSPFRNAVAFLPFEIRALGNQADTLRFVVTKVMKTLPENAFEKIGFTPGAEITRWGLTPIAEAAEIAAQLMPGSNRAATISRGAALLTLRPLASAGWLVEGGPPYHPAQDVILEYRPAAGGKLRAAHFTWGVATGFQERAGVPAAAFSENHSLTCAIDARRALMNHGQILYEQWARDVAKMPEAPLVSNMPAVFQLQHTGGNFRQGFTDPLNLTDPQNPEKRFAHLRIRSFPMRAGSLGTESLIAECKRLLTALNTRAPDGLILDIRGNPGGDIRAAECMLQMLTPRRIAPCRFHFGRTRGVLKILRQARSAGSSEEFKPWFRDASGRVSTRDRLTSGQPLTSIREANRIGQVYQGPVVLLMDARSYSAADIFAAGFQDHRIGPVIGVDPNTGGGGANFWGHSELLENLPTGTGLKVKALPGDARMTVAVRRASRTGRNRGLAIEDTGVKADLLASVTQEDLIFADESVIRFCSAVLARQKCARVEVPEVNRGTTEIRVRVRCQQVESLIFFLDGRRAFECKTPAADEEIVIPGSTERSLPETLRVHGISKTGRIAAVTTVRLQPEEET